MRNSYTAFPRRWNVSISTGKSLNHLIVAALPDEKAGNSKVRLREVEQMESDLKALVELDGGLAVAIAIVIDALARKQLVTRDDVLSTLREASGELEGSYAAKALDLVIARANELGEFPPRTSLRGWPQRSLRKSASEVGRRLKQAPGPISTSRARRWSWSARTTRSGTKEFAGEFATWS